MRLLCLIPFLCFSLSPASTAASANDPGDFSIRATIPLEKSQVKALRNLIASDPEAKDLFKKLEADAKELIGAEPTPLAKIHYEGLVNTNPKRIADVVKLRQMDDAALLFRYWQASGNEDAAATLKAMVLAWTGTYIPTGNDVNENKLHPLLNAYEALRETYPLKEKREVDAWVLRFGKNHEKAVRTSDFMTNRYTKHLRLLSISGRILGKTDWQETAVTGLKRFVTESLRADGTSLDLERRDTLTYHCSALRPAIELAVLSGKDGAELYNWKSENGGSIRKSVDYVVPFADGSKTRKEWLNTTVELDRKRAAEGLEAYRAGRLFDPTSALTLIEEAAYFDKSLIPLARKLHGKDSSRFPSWALLVNEAIAPVAANE